MIYPVETHEVYKIMFARRKIERKIKDLYKFPWTGDFSPKDFELLGAVLMGDTAKKNYRGNGIGADLCKHEVKSAKRYEKSDPSYEYQYGKVTGFKKLKEELEVDHVFFSYWNEYYNLEAWLVPIKNKLFRDEIALFEEKINEDYVVNDEQRCRPGIRHTLVKETGKLIMKIVDGKLVLPTIRKTNGKNIGRGKQASRTKALHTIIESTKL